MPHTLMLISLLMCLSYSSPAEATIPGLPYMRVTAAEIQTAIDIQNAVEMQTAIETQTAAEIKTVVEVQILAKSTSEYLPEPPVFDYKAELKKMGYYKYESKDEKLNLRNAILRFQSSCNLTVNGVWNNKCRNIMALRLATGVKDCEDHIKKPPTDGKWMVINKSKRILTLYENNEVLQKYPVAIGNPPSLTPDGMFTVDNKIINPYWGGGGYAKPVRGGVPDNPLGYRWLGLSYKDGGTLGIHGNNSPYSIGKDVSHGCIRMINADVERLFTVVPLYAPVWIGTNDKLEEWGVVQYEYGTGMETAKTVTKIIKDTVPSTPSALEFEETGSQRGETPTDNSYKKTPAGKTPGAVPDNEDSLPKEGTVLPDFINFPHQRILSVNFQ